jgi:hypothetical protein
LTEKRHTFNFLSSRWHKDGHESERYYLRKKSGAKQLFKGAKPLLENRQP